MQGSFIDKSKFYEIVSQITYHLSDLYKAPFLNTIDQNSIKNDCSALIMFANTAIQSSSLFEKALKFYINTSYFQFLHNFQHLLIKPIETLFESRNTLIQNMFSSEEFDDHRDKIEEINIIRSPFDSSLKTYIDIRSKIDNFDKFVSNTFPDLKPKLNPIFAEISNVASIYAECFQIQCLLKSFISFIDPVAKKLNPNKKTLKSSGSSLIISDFSKSAFEMDFESFKNNYNLHNDIALNDIRQSSAKLFLSMSMSMQRSMSQFSKDKKLILEDYNSRLQNFSKDYPIIASKMIRAAFEENHQSLIRQAHLSLQVQYQKLTNQMKSILLTDFYSFETVKKKLDASLNSIYISLSDRLTTRNDQIIERRIMSFNREQNEVKELLEKIDSFYNKMQISETERIKSYAIKKVKEDQANLTCAQNKLKSLKSTKEEVDKMQNEILKMDEEIKKIHNLKEKELQSMDQYSIYTKKEFIRLRNVTKRILTHIQKEEEFFNIEPETETEKIILMSQKLKTKWLEYSSK